ncbi:MAG: hypothetical protein J6Q33_03220, partial [Alistipes sp.]|nr:hypothetical protein [Alistipes sp.]
VIELDQFLNPKKEMLSYINKEFGLVCHTTNGYNKFIDCIHNGYIYKFNIAIPSKNGVNTNIIRDGFGALFRVGLGSILSGVEVEFLLGQVKNYAAICGKLWGTF